MTKVMECEAIKKGGPGRFTKDIVHQCLEPKDHIGVHVCHTCGEQWEVEKVS